MEETPLDRALCEDGPTRCQGAVSTDVVPASQAAASQGDISASFLAAHTRSLGQDLSVPTQGSETAVEEPGLQADLMDCCGL